MVRARGLAQRGPAATTLDPFVGRPDLRRRRGRRSRRLEPRDGARTARSSPASSRPACSAATDGGATWTHVEGLTRPPDPTDLGARRRRPDPAHDRPPPDGSRIACGSGSRPSACSRRATAGRRGSRATSASAPDFIPGPVPDHRPVRAQVRDGRRRARDALPAEPLRRVPLRRRRRALDRAHRQRPAGQFGFPLVTHPRDPDTVWVIPLNGDDQGRFVPDGKPAVWRTHDRGDSWIRADDGPARRRTPT